MDAIAIADANKIRAAMGLAPLPVPGSSAPGSKPADQGVAAAEDEDTTSTLDRRTAAAGSNWAKLEAERQAQLERQKRKEALKKQRDAAQRYSKLEGTGLADIGDEEQDTRSWLKGQRKRQKKIEKARLSEAEKEAAAKAAQKEYSAADLKGIRVGHEIDDFGEGEQVLTLRDTEIGDGDESGEDELENAELVEKEKIAENISRKKKKVVYDPNEVNDGESTFLGHYDEEISGKKRKRFTLDDKGGGEKKRHTDDDGVLVTGGAKGVKISLDALMDDTPVNDYAEAAPTRMKKAKKPKKERKARQREVDEDDVVLPAETREAMDVDGTDDTSRADARPNIVEDDDDDLQSQLALRRRQALKNRKKQDAAELARQLKEQDEQAAQGDEDAEEPGMVIDETREFVAHLERPDSDDEDARAERRRRTSTPAAEDEAEDAEGDIPMSPSNDEDLPTASNADQPNASNILDEEETTGSLGSVASMLRKRGLIAADALSSASATAEHDRRHAEFMRTNAALLSEFDGKARQAREADRSSGVFSRMNNAQQQEYARRENERREAYLAQLQARHFRDNYRPEVKLGYYDEFGRELGQKEAFKHLSHMFHGKGSGKGKMEKRLKKIEDEKRRAGKGLLGDNSVGMEDVRAEQGRRRGQAGVRLQ